MDVPLSELATTAHVWDEQHLDLQAAAGQVVEAPTSEFTAVAGAAERFTTTWGRHLTDLAASAESHAGQAARDRRRPRRHRRTRGRGRPGSHPQLREIR